MKSLILLVAVLVAGALFIAEAAADVAAESLGRAPTKVTADRG